MATTTVAPDTPIVHPVIDDTELFRCTYCKEGRPRSFFTKSQVAKSGWQPHCRPCRNAQAKERYANSKRIREIAAERARLRNYGILPHEFGAMVAAQNGLCGVCAESLNSGKKPAVDHCHATGRIRGILCARCNTTIGAALDSPSLLRDLAAYVERHSEIAPQLIATRSVKCVITPGSENTLTFQHRYISPDSAAAMRDAGGPKKPQPPKSVEIDTSGWLPGL